MNTPRRVHLSRKKGFTLPPNTVIVDGRTKWGNPWKVGMRLLALTGPDQGQEVVVDHARAVKYHRNQALSKGLAGRAIRAKIRAELKGKNLACWCPLDAPCHADILLRLAVEEEVS